MTDKDRDAQDLRLSAWLDGELDKDGADEMSALISSDETLASRAERLGRIDALMRAAVPEEALPPQLLERLGLAEAAPAANVVDLAAVREARTAAAAPRPVSPGWASGALWRIAAQVLVIGGVGLGAALWLAPHDRHAAPEATYRTLSNAPRAAAVGAPTVNAVIVFAEGTDPNTAGQVAASADVRLVGQPNAAGAWKASIAPGRRAATLDALRRTPGVTMAEPIDGAAP